MPRITILAVGKLKDPLLGGLEDKYLNRLSHYVNVEVKCLQDSPVPKIIKALSDSDHIIVLDQKGTAMTSEGLACELQNLANRSVRNVVFVIGGAYGLDESVRRKANRIISLSAFTFPHELARIILLEQLYRAHTLLRGEKYHH